MDETQMMEFVGQAVADVGALLGGASAGFAPLRRVAETPYNIVLEARA